MAHAGVGGAGWAELGVDPADYARRLVAGIEREFRRDPSICDVEERPLLTMLTKSFEELKLEAFPGAAPLLAAPPPIRTTPPPRHQPAPLPPLPVDGCVRF